MKNLMILVKMQLKERLNFKRLDVKNVSVFNIAVSILGALLKFFAVFAMCYALLFAAKSKSFFAPYTVPITVMSLLFVIMTALSALSCVIGITRSMYYSRDNAVLLTLPCMPIQVYASKLIIFFIFEYKRNLSFLVPLFIAYYSLQSYKLGAYFWLPVCMLFVSMFTVAVGALLSIPAMWIANFFRQHKGLQIGVLATAVALSVAGIFYAISLIPDQTNIAGTWSATSSKINEFFREYTQNYSFMFNITRIIVGEQGMDYHMALPFIPTAVRALLLLAISAVLLALGVVIVAPLFYAMASKPFEYLKKAVKPKRNKLRSRRFSAVYTEWLSAFKNSARISTNVGILIGLPMLMFFMNKVYGTIEVRSLGNHMILAFNVLIILLVVLNANCSSASIFSKDGRSNYLIKTQPSKYPILILSKLMPDTAFISLSLFFTFVVMAGTVDASFIDILVMMLSIGFIYLAHMLYSAELDLMNPQIELYATVGNTESNPNETRSTVTAFLLSFIVALAVFLLLLEGSGYVFTKLIIVSALALCYRVYIFFAKLRLYYNDR